VHVAEPGLRVLPRRDRDAIAAVHEPGAGRERRRREVGKPAPSRCSGSTRSSSSSTPPAAYIMAAARGSLRGSLRSVFGDWGKTRATGMLARPRQRR
jgi:hypothetical protein